MNFLDLSNSSQPRETKLNTEFNSHFEVLFKKERKKKWHTVLQLLISAHQRSQSVMKVAILHFDIATKCLHNPAPLVVPWNYQQYVKNKI